MEEFRISVTQAEYRRLTEFVEAIRTPCTVELAESSPFNNPEFESEFRSKLLTHHHFLGSPLFQESFDSAFLSACTKAGFATSRAPAGQRFWDIMIDGRRISLKSTKAKDLRPEKLYISKLTEAAWIQDCRTPSKRQDQTFKLFREYKSQVDSILQLRYFLTKNKYELMEIPVTLFDSVFDVDKAHFASDGPTINIPIGKDPPDFTLRIDRSDAKITIANINRDLCITHGIWQL